MAVEGQLGLGHRAEGSEGAGDHSVSRVSVDSHRSSGLTVLYHVLYEVAGLGLGHLRGLQGDADDDPVARPQPESAAAHMQGGDPHEGEAQLAGTWREETRRYTSS